MSSNSLGVSIGLAAIDGLLCAFVAILTLALVLIGPGASTSAPDIAEAHTLLFIITKADPGTAGIDLRMLVNVRAEGSSDAAAFTVESGGRMTRLKGLNRHVQGGGDVWWRDCQVLAGNRCPATLFVTRIKPGERWQIRLRVADAANSFTVGSSSYQVRAVLDSSATQEGLVLTPDRSVDICADWDKKTIDIHCKESARPG